MKIRQANLQIASTALLTLGFLGSVSVRPLHAPERQRRKPSGGAPVFSPRNDGIVGGPSVGHKFPTFQSHSAQARGCILRGTSDQLPN